MDGVAIGVKFEFGSSDFSKSKDCLLYTSLIQLISTLLSFLNGCGLVALRKECVD